MAFQIEYSTEADGDLSWFERSIQVLIDEGIEVQLAYEPLRETRNRKLHRRTEAVPADWELRIGEYRVFYDVSREANLVSIVNIGFKPRETLYIRGQAVADQPT